MLINCICKSKQLISVALLFFLFSGTITGQVYYQKLSGVVIDADSRNPLKDANIEVETLTKTKIASTDSSGRFVIMLPPGRHSLIVTFLGYNSRIIKDILIGTGKETFITVELTESHIHIDEVVVRGDSRRSLNSMATVSVRRLSNQDAARYAGGYYDPLRMVTNFPGVSASNDDGSNQVIIRGNSPRGILWRLEGIEIPNPNHLSSGQGASSGAYSMISTNVLSGFDFYTGAFPAEYGNGYSGVMDLNLRSGNSTKPEFSLGVSVVGAEVSAEGPLYKNSGSSWFGNFRYANFDFLGKYGVIDTEEIGIIPRSTDWAFKTSIKTKKAGTFDFFSVGGSSLVGDLASDNKADLKNGADNNEYVEKQFTMVAGVKHLWVLPDTKTYIRTTVGYTYQQDSTSDHTIDTLLKKTLTYSEMFKYPSLRVSILVNHKFNANNTLRFGVNINSISGDMLATRYISKNLYDTLIKTKAQSWYNGYYLQWKYNPDSKMEINTGLHIFHSGVTHEFVLEPRLSMKFYLSNNQTITFGTGLHSRLEPLAIYNYKIRIDNTHRYERNSNLKAIKALHFTLGYDAPLGTDTHIGLEAYFQSLFDVPVSINTQSQYSILNSSYGLPDVIMVNNGKGMNAGIELTIEKDFTHKYYYLFTASLFDSRYKAQDGNWYNTYYNNGYIFNLTAGKEFAVGHKKQNMIGLNFKTMLRGGFCYTPVDYASSLIKKRLVYKISDTNGDHLPLYERFDLGMSYRLNGVKSAWIFMVDIQNITNRKNVVRNRFSYNSGVITESVSKSIGLVPIASIKLEF